MLRWILIALAIYMLYRLIRGPKQRNQGGFTFHFGRFNPGENGNQNRGRKHQRPEQNLDQIEEAEFEDITDKEINN